MVNRDPVGAAVECLARLGRQQFGTLLFELAGGDVGWVADDRVDRSGERFVCGKWGEKVALMDGHARAWDVLRDGARQVSGSGAHVDDELRSAGLGARS